MGDQQGRLELEGPFIRAPVEGLSQVFRSTQKTVVREMGVISHMVEELAAVDPSKPPVSCGDGEEVDRRLEEMIERLEALKVTVQRADAKEAKFACCARERISNLAVPNEYMSDKADTTSSVTALRMWEDRRIDRWVGDFLLQRGHSAVAGAFAASQQLEGLLDSELHERIALAANALRDEGDCRPALEWCEDNAAKLRRRGSTLEFQLRKREFVDMVRKGCRNQALDYAEQYLSPWSETQADEVQQAMATLLYSGRVHEAPSRMGELLNGGGREELASAFVSEARASFGLPSIPVLELALQCGLSALKTPLCYEFCEECDTGCPVCSECGRILAKGLPFSHHSHSTLICRLSGEVMDDSNPPLALPNGRVYSSNALRSMAEGGGGEVTCPVTKEKFPIESARSLYII